MRDKEGRGLVNAHVLGFLRRIAKLLFYGIKPVFVFDGGAPALKRATLNERKKKKAGAALNHAQLAEKILAAKLRREAIQHASGSKNSGKQKANDVPLDDSTVYLEDIDHSRSKTPKKAKAVHVPSSSEKKKTFHDHDPYNLPDVDLEAAVSQRTQVAATADPRLATEDELHAFLASITPEDLDITSPEFHTLPTSIQYEIIGDLRLKSRQTSHARLQKMLRSSQTPLDFSKAQIAHLKERNQLTQRLLMTTDSIGSAHIAIPVRIASERNREYVLVKNGGMEGGWILGIRDLRGTEEQPIVLDHGDGGNQPIKPNEIVEDDSDADMEEVPIADPDLLAYQREMALDGIAKRSGSNRRTIPTSMFLDDTNSNDLSSSGTQGKSQHIQDDDDDDVALAIQQSMEHAKATQLSLEVKSKEVAETGPEETVDDDDDIYVPYSDFTPLGTALSFANASSRPHSSPSKSFGPGATTTSSSPAAQVPTQSTSMFSFKGTGLLGTRNETNTDNPRSNTQVVDSATHREQQEMDTLLTQTNRLFQEHESDSSDDMEEVPFPVPASTTFTMTSTVDQKREAVSIDSDDSNDDMEEVTIESPMHPQQIPVSSTKSGSEHPSFSNDTQLDLGGTSPSGVTESGMTFADPGLEAIEISVPIIRKSLPALHQHGQKGTGVTDDHPQPLPAPAFKNTSISKNLTSGASTDVPSTLQHSESNKGEESDQDEELIPWSRSPSPQRGAQGDQVETADHAAWDAAEEMDLHAEEGEFAMFLSQVKGKTLESIQQEIDDELQKLNQQRRAAMRDAEDVTQQMITQIMIMLRLFGIPYITAPMEAEAQCAELVSLGLVDGVITDDSDVFLFGAQRVYKNMFNQSKTVECFLSSDLSRELGLTRDTLIQLAYLLGSDYTEGLPGVGPVVAMELLKEFPGRDGLFRFRDWWLAVQSGKDNDHGQSTFRRRFKKRFKDLYLTSDWPNTAVRDAYYHPTVDSSEEPFKWGLPDLDGLHQFLHQELGWQQDKVDELLLPIIQKMNKRREAAAANQQGVLNEFLDISGSGTHAPRQRQAYASKRLQQVISDFRKRQNRGSVSPGSDENMVEEHPDSVPKPATKKRRRKSPTPKSSDSAPSKKPKKPRATKSKKRRVSPDPLDDSSSYSDTEDYEANATRNTQAENPLEADRRVALNLRPRPKPRPTYKGSVHQGGDEEAQPPTMRASSPDVIEQPQL
ncbi:hypothetical protein CVT24_009350 [Panaeolus cyanescens]|uniref:XPG-I domain-containing protein n=1 Tax=Panaeolus cyanescens TaxID=181874 RepID=A0A409Y8C0_9AGAR|nr:hypothetical protein CVT24_009350 [Panaeolus cyanescens]